MEGHTKLYFLKKKFYLTKMGLLTERDDVTGSFGKICLIGVLQKRKFFSRQSFVSFLDLMYPLTCSSPCTEAATRGVL